MLQRDVPSGGASAIQATHPQTIVHLHPTLWPAPSQTVRRSQAERRRLRRRALIFRLEARAPGGPPGLAKCGTLVNVITSGEHGLDKTDGTTFEEQETDSRTCEGVFCNVDVKTNVVGLITDCTGDFDAIAGVRGSAAMCGEELFYNADVNTNVVGFITNCTCDFGTTAGVPDSAATCGAELEEKHEQVKGYNLCRDDTDPCGFAEMTENMRFVH